MASKPTGLYRTMLRMARALPKERRTVAIQQIKNSWNEHKAETDPKRINELVAEANKRLRMLQMMTPKSKTANEQSGVISYVVRDGKVVSGEAVQQEKAKHSTFGPGNVDPESLARHESQMRRFHFMDRE